MKGKIDAVKKIKGTPIIDSYPNVGGTLADITPAVKY